LTVGGRAYRFLRQVEEPLTTPKAGMSDHAKWLLEEDIIELLEEGGFAPVTVINRERQRNGTRITLLAGPRSS
jgi:tRNA (mo5U34)-methyltransferase